MSERGKRVFRFLLDPERDADVITRIESEQSYVGYIRKLVKRDMYDGRLDYAALKLSEMQAENVKLRALLIGAFVEFVQPYGDADAVHEYSERMHELGIEVEQ